MSLQTRAAVLSRTGAARPYADSRPLVLANEIPDTPRLRATFECAPGSSIVRLTLYGAAPAEGLAVITSAAASANAEVSPRRGQLQAMLRADHPVFAAFVVGGRMTVAVGESQNLVTVERSHIAKLRRFAELCTG